MSIKKSDTNGSKTNLCWPGAQTLKPKEPKSENYETEKKDSEPSKNN